MPGLTDKQQLFVVEYLVDLNATAAYGRAGYQARGNAARVNASRLLTNANVQAAIGKAMQKRIERTKVTGDRVVKELARLAFTDMRNFVRWGEDGVLEFKPSDELTNDDSPAVTEVKLTPTQYGTTMQIKLGHKDSALRLLAEHTGIVGTGGMNLQVNVDANESEKRERIRQELSEFERRRRAQIAG